MKAKAPARENLLDDSHRFDFRERGPSVKSDLSPAAAPQTRLSFYDSPERTADIDRTYYEFFAGGGMARAGLGARWQCTFANDLDPKKCAIYARNWGPGEIVAGDVGALSARDVPGRASLAWASFPCQDLSLAGHGAGLRGERSGIFWPFWKLMEQLGAEGRAPRIIVLENVCGTLTSHGGRDFAAIADALTGGGYRFGAVVIDASAFVPQSRARLFIVAVHAGAAIPSRLRGEGPAYPFHTKTLVAAEQSLSDLARSKWIWWRLPPPQKRSRALRDILEDEPTGVRWHSEDETARLVGMMSPVHQRKLETASRSGEKKVGTLYRRMRIDDSGVKTQRAEVRFDDVAGCLRTAAGGSSRQTIVVVEGDAVRSRLLSAREAARLMGLPDDYALPEKYNEAYHLAGDGVVAPVVRFLAESLLEPLVDAAR